ncbi:MAG: ribose 5-phosphate isomerase B [Desulfovibrionales bacterium]
MDTKTVLFGSDHAGYPLKEILKEYLRAKGYDVQDLGPHTEQSCDYPVYAAEVAKHVLASGRIGILICGSGMGMSMTANRFKGIRAALCTNEFLARMSRRHNNANILCLGHRVIGQDLAKSIVDTFLENEFEDGRHKRRVDLIDDPDLTSCQL